MTARSSLLRAMILAAATTPAIGCGGKTDSTTGESSTQGQGGGAGSSTAGQGGTGTSGSSGQGGSGGTTVAVPWPCKDAQPVTVGGKPTGYDQCADGTMRRREVIECPSLLPRATTCGGNPSSECKADADCKAKPNGHCQVFGFQGGDSNDYCGCSYGCTRDSDCLDDQICQCGDPVGHCVAATCTSNADCGEGDCANFGLDVTCNAYGFACLKASDTCGGNTDCSVTDSNLACVSNGTSRSCANPTTCVPGRPLFVEQAWRQAALVAGAGWGLSRRGLFAARPVCCAACSLRGGGDFS